MATGVDKLKSLLGAQSTGSINRLASALGKTYTAPQMHTVPAEKKVFLPQKLSFTVPKSETLSDKRNRLQELEQQQAGLPIVLNDYDARNNQLSQEIGTLKDDVKSYFGAADPGPLLAQMGTQTKSPYKEYRLNQREDEITKLQEAARAVNPTAKLNQANPAARAEYQDLNTQIEAKQAVLDKLHNKTGTEAIDPIFKGLSGGFLEPVVTAMFKNPFLKYSPQVQIAKWAGFDAEDKLKNLVSSNTDYFTQKVNQAKEYSGKGYDAYATVAEGVGGALPQAVLAVMSGGTSAAAALPALGGNAGMATAVQTGLTTLAKNPQFLPSFMQSYGSAYNDAIASGATEEQAQLSAILSGLAVSGIEMAGGIQKLPGEVEKGTESLGKALFKSALQEGAEEPAQGIVQRSVAKGIYNPSAPIASVTDPNAVFNPVTAAQEFGMGATVGGILGGGQIGVQSIINNSGLAKPSLTTQTPTQNATLTQQTNLPKGTGAAEAGFDQMAGLVDKYGFIKPGETPVSTDRVVELPKQTSDNMKLSQTVRTALEAQATTNETADKIEQATLDEQFSYKVNTDKGALERARSTIENKGYDAALRDWTASMRQSKTSKDLTALGWTLYNNAANSGNAAQAVEILTDIVDNVRASAQTVQAVRLLKQMSPEAQLYAAQRSVSNLQDELTGKYGDKAPNLQIDETAAQEYLDALKAKDEAGAKQAMDKIYRGIAAQVPATFADKFRAWRYMSMLTNPVTHIKNIVGNYVFRGERAVKNVLAAGIEKSAQGVGNLFGADLNRTRSVLTFKDRPLIKQALDDYNNVVDEIFRYGKYDVATNKIEEYRTIFKNRALEGVRKANTTALQTEDNWVSKPAYVNSLAGYLKANKATFDTASTDLLDRARAFAVQEAQKASYRDSNAFSDFVSNLGYKGNNAVGKAANVLIEGVIPFKRTPANILVRGLENSPLGLIKTLTADSVRLAKGDITGGQYIDNLASGLTGTALTALGMLLARWGIISVGGTGDEKQDDFDKLQGKQAFAITLGDKSYTIDWLAPAAMPLFVGVSIYNKWTDKSDKGFTLSDALKVVSDISEPLLETSMLSSFNDYLEGIGSAKQRDENVLYYLLAQSAMNYLSQTIPTLGGRINRTIDDTRRTVFTDPQSGVPSDIQYFSKSQLNKIPGASTLNEPYVDRWGRTQTNGNLGQKLFQNFLSPGYAKDVNTSPMEEELQRLYDDYAKENKVNVLPPTTVSKYFSNDGEHTYMTADEYTQFKTTYGQAAYKELTKLTGSSAYKNMTDEEKADAVSDVWSNAAETSKTEVMESRGEMRIKDAAAGKKIQGYVDAGLSQNDAYGLYKVMGALEPEPGASSVSNYQKISAILDLDFGQKQTVSLVGDMFTTHDTEGNVSKESLLPYLNNTDRLLSLYNETGNSEVISMTIPDEFTQDKIQYTLTNKERDLFKKTYTQFFNGYVTTLSTAEQIGKIRDGAYKSAKMAVIQSRY